MTISLSSYDGKHNLAPNEKVISLREISDFRQPNPQVNGVVDESEQIDYEQEITERTNEIKSLEEKKEKLLQDMKQAIEKEKEAWLVTKEEERKQAQDVGYKTGYDAGLEEAKAEYTSLIEEANKIIENAQTEYFKTIANHEQAIIHLAITTAEKITKRQVSEAEDVLVEMIKHAVEDLQKRSNISIYVQPADYEFVMNGKEELEVLLEDGEIISIYADENLNPGDCVIKHPYGQLRIGIDVQLQQIKTALEEKLSEN